MLTRALLAGSLLMMGCRSFGPSGPAPAPRVAIDADPVDLPGLHHVASIAPGLVSGGEPDGEVGYDTLKSLGVRTVISVDAVPPRAEIARARGIRVVHIPIGYDGVPDDARRAIAHALTTLDGPIYVHCHHGKHRGPAALASGAACAGAVTPDEVSAYLTLTGTSHDYPGLWRDALAARPLDKPALDDPRIALPERAPVAGVAGAMGAIDRAWDRVKLAKSDAWFAPADHPDLAPASDLGLIHDLLRSLRDDPMSIAHGEAFRDDLETSIALAERAEHAVRSGDRAGADAAAAELGSSCKACHAVYRD